MLDPRHKQHRVAGHMEVLCVLERLQKNASDPLDPHPVENVVVEMVLSGNEDTLDLFHILDLPQHHILILLVHRDLLLKQHRMDPLDALVNPENLQFEIRRDHRHQAPNVVEINNPGCCS